MTALLLWGCNSAQPASSAAEGVNPDPAPEVSEPQSVAEAALGKQAEVLAQGDLARDGLDQILAVNRQANAQRGDASAASSAALLVVRAAILEKRDGKWAEVLRCDERLKNPNGYLAGSPAVRVSGWRLEYDPNAEKGLQMKFTPADAVATADTQAPDGGEPRGRAIVVRWNARVKRYQSLDASHEKFLNEVPTLETPSSILR